MKQQEPSNRRGKSICLPVESEAAYEQQVTDPRQFRQWLEELSTQHPELFPAAMPGGFTLPDSYWSVKQELHFRRIKLKATGAVFLVRPSCVVPYLAARTDEVEKALYLRRWGVPFEALAYVFGRDAMFDYRVWRSLGRPSLVGSTVKRAAALPAHLLADEKHTWWQGQRRYVATTVGGGCLLGAAVVAEASTEALRAGYGEFLAAARDLVPAYQPKTVCTDGWHSTREAWHLLVPTITLIRCFLHAVLKINARCRGALRQQVDQQAWHVYHAVTKRQFGQRVRRLREWVQQHTSGTVQEAVLKLCAHRAQFQLAYDVPGAARTSNGLDRLMDYQDRILYQMRYFHGSRASTRLGARAMALHWNFHPYGARAQREGAKRSPFDALNGFQYHPNWLHNLFTAASLGGRKL